MARNNTVPLGQAGTGAAFILPDSKSLDGLLQNIEQNRKMGLLNVQAKNAYKDKVNKDFQDNALKVKGGILYQDEINKDLQKWIDKGVEYRTQGFNPFSPNASNPDEIEAAGEYMKERARIESMVDTRGLYEKNFMEQQNLYEKGGMDEDSWGALNDFYKNNSLKDLQAGGVIPPTLMKAFDQAKFMEGISAPSVKSNSFDGNMEVTRVVPNMGAIRLGVEGALKQNPQAIRNFNKNIARVDPSATPAKTIIGSVDPNEVGTYLDQYYKSPEGATEVLSVFPKGTVPSFNAPEYKQFIADATRKQLDAETRYEKGLDALTEQKAAEVNQQNIKKYNFDLNKEARAAAEEGRKQLRIGWAAENQGWKREDRKLKDEAANIRDENIQGLTVGNKEHVMRFRQLAKSKGGHVGYLPNGDLKVAWKNPKGEMQTKIINLGDPSSEDYYKGDAYAELNEVWTALTGKKVDIETLQGRKPYEGGLVNVGEASLTKDQIKKLRDNYGTDYKAAADLFMKNNFGFKNRIEALKAASEILDPKGKEHIIKQKK